MSIKKSFFNQPANFFYIQQNTVYLIFVILLGGWLRLYSLGSESFWFDEMYTVYLVSQDLKILAQQIATQGDVTRNAVYYLLAHFWVLPFEVTEISIRSLSVLFGVLSIGMMYLVGRQLFGEKVGLLSSFLMAVSEFQIQYSQEARFYSLFVLLTLASLYCYILALRTRRRHLWLASSLINILLFYTHTFAVFVFAAEYIHYLIYWRENKNAFFQWSISQSLLALAVFVGFIPMIRAGNVVSLSDGLIWITDPSFKDLFRIVYQYLFPQNYQHSWLFVGASFGAGFLFFVAATLCISFRKTRIVLQSELKNWFQKLLSLGFLTSEFVLVVVWFVCPIVLPFIYSKMFHPILVDRYTICAAPAFYLLIANAISRIDRVAPIFISLTAMMIVIVPGLQDYYAADVNEQWQNVAAYVQENSQINDVLVFAPDDKGYQNKSFDWYYQGNLPSCGIKSSIKDNQAVADIFSNCIMGHERFWVIMRGPAVVVDRFMLFFLNPNELGARLIEEKQFVKVSVYLFEISK